MIVIHVNNVEENIKFLQMKILFSWPQSLIKYKDVFTS